MDEHYQRLIYGPDVTWSTQLAEHKARSAEFIARAREVLKQAVGSDTFLGRQHYEIIPLPYEELDRLDSPEHIAVCRQIPRATSQEADRDARKCPRDR